MPGPGGRLVGGDDDAPDPRPVVERLERDDHLDGGAVRVGDDAPVPGQVVRVHLGHDERAGRVHPPRGAVVDDDRALADGLRGADRGWRLRRPRRSRCRCPRSSPRSPPGRRRCRPANVISVPATSATSSGRSSFTGNRRCSSVLIISVPTMPAAPTTATFHSVLLTAGVLRCAVDCPGLDRAATQAVLARWPARRQLRVGAGRVLGPWSARPGRHGRPALEPDGRIVVSSLVASRESMNSTPAPSASASRRYSRPSREGHIPGARLVLDLPEHVDDRDRPRRVVPHVRRGEAPRSRKAVHRSPGRRSALAAAP